MKIKCPSTVCGKWHTLSPTAMLVVVNAYAAGDLQRVIHGTVVPVCLVEAFGSESCAELKGITSKQIINVDDKTWSLEKKQWL